VRAAAEQAVVTEALGPPGTRCRVDVSVQVLQSDGGAAACAVNAALLALAHAGVPLRGLVAACACARPPGCAQPLLDPAHEETAAAGGGAGGSGGDVVVAVQVGGGPGAGRVVMASAEGRLPLADVEACVALSAEGCRAVAARMREALLRNARGVAVGQG
jgi:exosome complex component RRP41